MKIMRFWYLWNNTNYSPYFHYLSKQIKWPQSRTMDTLQVCLLQPAQNSSKTSSRATSPCRSEQSKYILIKYVSRNLTTNVSIRKCHFSYLQSYICYHKKSSITNYIRIRDRIYFSCSFINFLLIFVVFRVSW